MHYKMNQLKIFMVILIILLIGNHMYDLPTKESSFESRAFVSLPEENSRSETMIYKNITNNTIWRKEGSPYIINNTIHILDGIKLSIEPGVNVIFNELGVLVGGLLENSQGDWPPSPSSGIINASGTNENKIIFTSSKNNILDNHFIIGGGLNDQYIFKYCEFYSTGSVSLFGSDDCIFINCNFYGDAGIIIDKADATGGDQYPSNNTISNCNFVNNYNSIIKRSGSTNAKLPNRFYQNNFINCTNPLLNDTKSGDYKDIWNDPARQGNHWYDYDGVGDTILPWHGVDYYPVIKRLPIVNDANQTWVDLPTPGPRPNNTETQTEEPEEEDSDGDGYNDTYENASGSDPHDNRSIPTDWDGDGVVNWEDDYPRDPTRWIKDDETWTNILLILIYISIGFVFILIVVTWYTRFRGKKILQNSNTTAVLACINMNPGLHYRALMDQMGMGSGALRHHLRKLDSNGHIKTVDEGKYKFYYPQKYGNIVPLSPIEKEIVHILAGCCKSPNKN